MRPLSGPLLLRALAQHCLPLATACLAAMSLARGAAPPAAPPATRAQSLIEIAEGLQASDPLRGIAPAKEAMALATSSREKLAAEALLADLLRQQTDYPAALELARTGLAEAVKLGDSALQGAFLCDLGRIQGNLAAYPDALKAFHEATAIGEKLRDARLLTDAHLGAFTIWLDFNENEAARAELQAAAPYALAANDPQRLADYYRQVGNSAEVARDLPAARAAHERSREISAAAGQARGVADADINLSGLDEDEGRLDEAATLARQAIAAYERMGLKRYLAHADRSLGRILLKQGRKAEALDYQERSLKLALALDGRAAIANSYRDLAATHEAVGDLAAALEDRRQLESQISAIFTEKSRQQIALLQAQYNAARSQTQLQLLRDNQVVNAALLRAARIERYALLALVLLGACAAAALLSRARLKLAGERRILEETRAAREAADEANALKTRLLGIASHDLRSPLSAMVCCADAIEAEAGNAPLTAELAADLRTEGRRLLALVSDLLDMARIESGKLETMSEPCDLAAIGVERARAYQAAATAKDQVLSWELPPSGSAPITGDPKRLAQVFDNLIGNAVKFTPPGGPIHLAVTTQPGLAIASVRDGGPGLRPEDYERLFQPFQTLSAQPTAGESSSGLGLYIAREIVARHGGRLGVESIPGGGATFTVELPLSPGVHCGSGSHRSPEARAPA